MSLHHHKYHHKHARDSRHHGKPSVYLIKNADTAAEQDQWVAGKPATRCAVKGPGWGQDKLRASYACPSVCGGTCEDSGSWTKTGAEDWKGCAWVSIHPLARCKVWGEEPGEEGRVLAATACPDSCA